MPSAEKGWSTLPSGKSKRYETVPCIHQFFGSYLPRIKGVSPNTLQSYRDTFRLLLPFAARHYRIQIPSLRLEHICPELILAFLDADRPVGGGSCRSLVGIGVSEEGRRTVFFAVQSGDKEFASTSRELFKDLKRSGLDTARVLLGIMDGLPGLEKVFRKEFPNVKVQRCQVHVARNVLAKAPRKFKKDIADEVCSIFYASSRNKALGFFEGFKAS